MNKKILIQGDDWGYSPETMAGIGEAYAHGVLTQTDVMVNLLDPARTDEYRRFFKTLENLSGIDKPKIGIGVHLNLTYGSPITKEWPVKEMSRPYKGSGRPEEWQGNAWKTYFSSYDSDLVEKEFRAQIERALAIFGTIDHLDSHHFIHSYEPIKGVCLKLAKEYRLAVRAIAPLSEHPVYGGDFIVDTNFQKEISPIGIKTPDRCVLTLFWNECDPLESFLNAVDRAPEGRVTEFMVHPAKGEKAEEWRVKDLAMLTDKKIIEYCKKHNIELVTYGQL